MTSSDPITLKNDQIYHSQDFTTIRNQKAAVIDEAWIKSLLHRGAFGMLATTGSDNQPFINTNNYVYDETRHCIYIHRARIGRTSANILHNPTVCYTVVEMGRMLAAQRVMDFNVEYRSVVLFGTAELVDFNEAKYALEKILAKYAPHLQMGVDYDTLSDDCPRAAAVYRINIEQWSGKKSEAPADFPGAYDYCAVRETP